MPNIGSASHWRANIRQRHWSICGSPDPKMNEVSLNTIQYTYNTISGGVMDPICVFTRPKIWLMCVFDTQYNIHTIQYRAASWTPHLTENVGVCEYILFTQYNIGRRHGPHLRVHLTQIRVYLIYNTTYAQYNIRQRHWSICGFTLE